MLLFYASFTDAKKRIIYNGVPIAIAAVAVIRIICGITPLLSCIFGMLIAAVPFFAAAMLKENSVGGGDVKLLAATGLFLGTKLSLYTVITASILLLAVTTIKRLKSKHKEESVAFAPYISCAAFIIYSVNLLNQFN